MSAADVLSAAKAAVAQGLIKEWSYFFLASSKCHIASSILAVALILIECESSLLLGQSARPIYLANFIQDDSSL